MKLTIKALRGKPLSWLIWHPHQGFWNWDLVAATKKIIPVSFLNKYLVDLIIGIDTLLLFLRVLTRRIKILGLFKLFSVSRIPPDVQVLYFDMGTHREGAELKRMTENILPRISESFYAYGFEASQSSYNEVKKHFEGLEQVEVCHLAMCHERPEDGKIRLFHSGNGLGDSLYRQGDSYEEVDAIRFSDWLKREDIDVQNNICILRMNIEGAESDVIADLIESGLVRHIDGYYGMWDDLSKIDTQKDLDFRRLLAKHKISPVTFNGRDIDHPLRMRCIEYDMHTHVQQAFNDRAGNLNDEYPVTQS